jgi:hypothetical protein
MKIRLSQTASLHRLGIKLPGLMILCCIGAMSLFLLVGCDVVPVRPEEVFILYRERMNGAKIQDARNLISPASLALVKQITEKHKLDNPPENPALLNILDPITAPTVVKMDDGIALLQVRTLKGGLRLIRLAREAPKSPWKVDITEELKSLQAFLDAKEALGGLQQQAGEFAASWKAFDNQLERMGGPEPEPKAQQQIKETVRKPAKPKPASKKSQEK